MEINTQCISGHIEQIANKVNEQFNNSKELIRGKILNKIKGYITPLPIHYEWQNDDCPYDHSGKLIENGIINLNQTITEFLENEYTGGTEATYISGNGLRYNTFGDDLSNFTLKMGGEILYNTTRQYLEDFFGQSIPDEIFDNIMDEYHDEIYDNCLASDFFSYEAAIEFVGIGNIKLTQL